MIIFTYDYCDYRINGGILTKAVMETLDSTVMAFGMGPAEAHRNIRLEFSDD